MSKIKKLKTKREKLWENKENVFCLRFNDISINQQCILAKRIKETSRIKHTRSEKGPSIEEIYYMLEDINPIIFAEYLSKTTSWFERYRPQTFGIYRVTALTTERFKKLCSLIYKMSIYKTTYSEEIEREAIKQTMQGYPSATQINEQLNQSPDLVIESEPLNHEELSLEEIERINNNNNNNNNNRNENLTEWQNRIYDQYSPNDSEQEPQMIRRGFHRDFGIFDELVQSD